MKPITVPGWVVAFVLTIFGLHALRGVIVHECSCFIDDPNDGEDDGEKAAPPEPLPAVFKNAKSLREAVGWKGSVAPARAASSTKFTPTSWAPGAAPS